MKNTTPTVIYRTRSFDDARSLADYLNSRNVEARLAAENPAGFFGELPLTDFVHDVMAVNFDVDELKAQVLEWEQVRTDLKASASKPYCYHCGLPVLESAVSCTSCGESLDGVD